MRVRTSKSKLGTRFYIIKTYYDTKGIEHTITVEKLGSEQEIREKTGRDPMEWAKERAAFLTEQEKLENQNISIDFSPSSLITKNYRYTFNVGYLFLQRIFYDLGLDKICASIQKNSDFSFNLTDILQKLCYGRILDPRSKVGTFEFSQTLLQQPDFDLHQMYRALDALCENFDDIQSELYRNTLKLGERKTGVIYYDCTNFFFEMEDAEPGTLCQYGKGKENRPLPIVGMGLFIDREGIPISMCINPGNTNEQVTMQPLEKKMLKDFGMSEFVVCTDAGLSSKKNKRYNAIQGRSYITTQSLKRLKAELRDVALDPSGWYLMGAKAGYRKYNLEELDEEKYKEAVFYKELPVDNDDFDERLIVTYSIKYRNYLRKIRDGQVLRARKALKNGKVRAKKNTNDFRRFITTINCTKEGEIAEKKVQSIDEDYIRQEERFDGFYAVSTNLADEEPSEIAKANHQRWQIEQCFRIMKSEFRSRPVYVRKDNRIKAHFLTCFLALVIYRYLEKGLNGNYSCEQLCDTLRKMNVREVLGEGYIPTYTRTDITDALHEKFGFRTDYQIITKENMKKTIGISQKNRRKQK
jgi:transposase